MVGQKDEIDNLISEIDVMKNLEKHDNIVHYLGSKVDEKLMVFLLFFFLNT